MKELVNLYFNYMSTIDDTLSNKTSISENIDIYKNILFEQTSSSFVDKELTSKFNAIKSNYAQQIQKLKADAPSHGWNPADIAAREKQLLAQRNAALRPLILKSREAKAGAMQQQFGAVPQSKMAKMAKVRSKISSEKPRLDVEKMKKLGKKWALPAAGVAAALALTRPKKQAPGYEE